MSQPFFLNKKFVVPIFVSATVYLFFSLALVFVLRVVISLVQHVLPLDDFTLSFQNIFIVVVYMFSV